MKGQEQFFHALQFAALKHRDHRRKNPAKSPYINHPIDVMHFLFCNGVRDWDALTGALLHDVLEDTETSYSELQSVFGLGIATIVAEVTDDKSKSKHFRKSSQLYFLRFKSRNARLIKIGDKVSNTRDLLDNPPEMWSDLQINGYLHWSLAICQSIFLKNDDIPEQLQQATNDHFRGLGVEEVDEKILNDYMDSLPR